jgi:hypothetical protein
MREVEESPNLKQCFFGEHLLRNPGRVAIVESEKTAIVSSHHFPEFIWLATGGSNGARFTEPDVCKVLDGREVVLFPDVGMFDRWVEKAGVIRRVSSCKIIVSDLLESRYGTDPRAIGWDLADVILQGRDEGKPVKKGLYMAQERDKELVPMDEPKAMEKAVDQMWEYKGWEPLEGFEGF